MDIHHYPDFLERIGYHVIKSKIRYWYNSAPRFYEYISPFALINPSGDEIRNLFDRYRMAAIKYCADQAQPGKPSFLYVVENKFYDLRDIQSRMRTTIHKGLKNCQVNRIDFEYLHDHGMRLNSDTLVRQKRFNSTFSNPKRWKAFYEAGSKVDGAICWGAFVKEVLAACMVAFITDGYSILLHNMSRTELLPLRINNALTYIATQKMLMLTEVQCVTHGREAIRNLPSLDDFKVKMGYKKRPLNQVVQFHPLFKSNILSSLW